MLFIIGRLVTILQVIALLRFTAFDEMFLIAADFIVKTDVLEVCHDSAVDLHRLLFGTLHLLLLLSHFILLTTCLALAATVVGVLHNFRVTIRFIPSYCVNRVRYLHQVVTINSLDFFPSDIIDSSLLLVTVRFLRHIHSRHRGR